MRFQIIYFFITLGIVLCQPAQAHADSDEENAQKQFDEGAADYMAKRYDQAAVKFRKAYAYSAEAIFLYNQAKSLEKLGNEKAALLALNQAIEQKEKPLPPELRVKALQQREYHLS